MTGELRVALIGFGLGGRAFHAPLIAATPGLRLVTIVTSNPERRAEAARAFPGAHVAESADWVWANADRHDLVVITTPNRSHVPLARAAMAAGIPVVVDKPMAATSRRGARPRGRSPPREGALTSYQNRRWDGEVLTAQKLIASGELGTITRFESRLDRWRPTRNGDGVARVRCAGRCRWRPLRPRAASHRSGAIAVRAGHATLCGARPTSRRKRWWKTMSSSP